MLLLCIVYPSRKPMIYSTNTHAYTQTNNYIQKAFYKKKSKFAQNIHMLKSNQTTSMPDYNF